MSSCLACLALACALLGLHPLVEIGGSRGVGTKVLRRRVNAALRNPTVCLAYSPFTAWFAGLASSVFLLSFASAHYTRENLQLYLNLRNSNLILEFTLQLCITPVLLSAG